MSVVLGNRIKGKFLGKFSICILQMCMHAFKQTCRQVKKMANIYTQTDAYIQDTHTKTDTIYVCIYV